MSVLYLGIGSNLGQREKYIEKALSLVNERLGNVLCKSSLYETDPWKFESKNKFLNSCAGVETTFSPRDCLLCLKDIERFLGRSKSVHNVYTDRVIDLDILLYDDLVIDEDDLKIPHPYIQNRYFVLKPLSEIAPGFIHPVLKKSISNLLMELNSQP